MQLMVMFAYTTLVLSPSDRLPRQQYRRRVRPVLLANGYTVHHSPVKDAPYGRRAFNHPTSTYDAYVVLN